LVAVRPEQMRLVTPEEGVMTGTLAASVLLGSVTVHEVAVGDDAVLHVHARPQDAWGVGDRVGVQILEGKGTVVHREGSSIEPA
jgi:ABC-type Fe3+/spermidine/putrescine transport system ATPase subunit